MNLAEKYNEKIRIEGQNQEVERLQKVKSLAESIKTKLSDEQTIKAIESYLLEYGALALTDFGCLCQSGFCTWQEGLTQELEPLIQAWDDKGVRLRPSIELKFRIETANITHNIKTLSIKELKEWYKNK